MHNFICNLSETIALNGHFIGTCYDGNSVFRLLQNKKKDESVSIFKNEKKIFELIKEYDETGFPNDEESLGYAIKVYQETINLYFREYLVNFSYFESVMEDYGFIPISNEESMSMGFTTHSGLFSELFSKMENETDIFSGKAKSMTTEEKKISFLNRYFIFKKVRNVDASTIMKTALSKIVLPEDKEENIIETEIKIKQNNETKPKGKKTKKKAIIKQIEDEESI